MILNHSGQSPKIDRSAWIAPDATVCGNVTIGPGSRILYGARVIAEAGGEIAIGRYCIVMENAVLRATSRHACKIGDHCLIGPNAHVVGATLEDEVFVATAAAIFHGAELGCGTEVRVHAVVHLRTNLPPDSVVPIGWVAVGDPPQIFSPDRHDEIWPYRNRSTFPNGFTASRARRRI
jgi:carbonic anhydrase/acetyltransferase-like protein (isoleucine patch superfamily)